MSGYVNDEYFREGTTIEDYINGNVPEIQTHRYYYGGTIPEGTPIVNVIMENGIQPDKNNLILRKLYPGLFKACLEYTKQKNRSSMYIYKEEGKPDVYNFFVINPDTKRVLKRKWENIRRSLSGRQQRFAYVSDGENKWVDDIRFGYRSTYYFYKFNKPTEQEEEQTENLLDTVYGDLPF